MDFIRKTAVGVSASLLLSLLLTFGVAFGLLRVFGTPGAIKHALNESNFYHTVVANALKEAKKQQSESNNNKAEIPLDKPEVQAIVQKAASPDFLQSQVEGTLDSVYAWLHGDKASLDFAIKLDDVKSRLAKGVEDYAQQHLATLPVCPDSQNSDVDPFTAQCLPKGADINAIAVEAKKNIETGDFLKEGQVTADTIKVDNNQTLAQKLKDVPRMYRLAVQALYGTGALALLCTLAVVFLSSSRRAGLKRAAIICIGAGVSLAILGFGASFGLQRASTLIAEDSALQKSILSVVQFLANDLRTCWMGWGVGLLVLGIGTLLALHFTKKKSTEPKAIDLSNESVGQPLADTPIKSSAAAKPTRPRRLVQ
jgi:hypothetical protein